MMCLMRVGESTLQLSEGVAQVYRYIIIQVADVKECHRRQQSCYHNGVYYSFEIMLILQFN